MTSTRLSATLPSSHPDSETDAEEGQALARAEAEAVEQAGVREHDGLGRASAPGGEQHRRGAEARRTASRAVSTVCDRSGSVSCAGSIVGDRGACDCRPQGKTRRVA